jgi:hypothetical protein
VTSQNKLVFQRNALRNADHSFYCALLYELQIFTNYKIFTNEFRRYLSVYIKIFHLFPIAKLICLSLNLAYNNNQYQNNQFGGGGGGWGDYGGNDVMNNMDSSPMAGGGFGSPNKERVSFFFFFILLRIILH